MKPSDRLGVLDYRQGQQHDVVMTTARRTGRQEEPSDPGLSFTIRSLAPSDSLSDITDLLHRAYAPLRQRGLHYIASNQDEATTRRRIARGECFVAECDCRLVGTVTFRPASETGGCDWYDKAEVASFERGAPRRYCRTMCS